MVLRIVHREQGRAYGRTVRDAMQEIEGRTFALTTAYTILERLETKGLVESQLTDPDPERGGHRKQFFKITGAGVQALTEAQQAYERRLSAMPAFNPCDGRVF